MLDNISEKINAILPQTQCGKCDFSGCKPYAEAISKGKADINQCPPGGKNGIVKIAKLLQVEYKPLNKKYGVIKPKSTAIIKEDDCIGCTLCILARIQSVHPMQSSSLIIAVDFGLMTPYFLFNGLYSTCNNFAIFTMPFLPPGGH